MQPSLSRGELAPGLHGRIDTAAYAISTKTCRNFVTRPTGGAVKRPGFIYRGSVKTGTLATRIFPFIYSTETRYVVEAGNLYFRFWYMTDAGLAQLESGGSPVEIATPYLTADLEAIRITQSADVLYLAHPDYQTRELRRTDASTFELALYDHRNGPFRPLNTNEGVRVAVSAEQGTVTVTSSDPIFEAGHVGALFYVEEQELQNTKPWEPGQKAMALGEYRRSDGKTYKSTAVQSGGSYYVSGSIRPIHESGRAWDGSGDVRNDGVSDYAVGVEWEFVHPGYGVVKLTNYVSATEMTGYVVTRVPDSCVGTATAANTWNAVGDGTTTAFSITGATATSVRDYSVTFDGVGVQP